MIVVKVSISFEIELMFLVKVSISLKSEFDPESLFTEILVKVSISLKSECDPEGSGKTCLSMGTGSAFRLRKLVSMLEDCLTESQTNRIYQRINKNNILTSLFITFWALSAVRGPPNDAKVTKIGPKGGQGPPK